VTSTDNADDGRDESILRVAHHRGGAPFASALPRQALDELLHGGSQLVLRRRDDDRPRAAGGVALRSISDLSIEIGDLSIRGMVLTWEPWL